MQVTQIIIRCGWLFVGVISDSFNLPDLTEFYSRMRIEGKTQFT